MAKESVELLPCLKEWIDNPRLPEMGIFILSIGAIKLLLTRIYYSGKGVHF
jgi:hypothetical protein